MTENGTVVWEDPPAKKGQGRVVVYAPLLDQVRQRPGEWALIRSYERHRTANTAAYDLRRGRIAPDYKGEFEYRAVEGKLYARFIGELGVTA